MQAIRLVKNSIIAIESPEAEVDDVDFVDDLEEVEDVVDRFRRSEQQAAHPSADAQGVVPPPFLHQQFTNNSPTYHDYATPYLTWSWRDCTGNPFFQLDANAAL